MATDSCFADIDTSCRDRITAPVATFLLTRLARVEPTPCVAPRLCRTNATVHITTSRREPSGACQYATRGVVCVVFLRGYVRRLGNDSETRSLHAHATPLSVASNRKVCCVGEQTRRSRRAPSTLGARRPRHRLVLVRCHSYVAATTPHPASGCTRVTVAALLGETTLAVALPTVD